MAYILNQAVSRIMDSSIFGCDDMFDFRFIILSAVNKIWHNIHQA